VNSPLVEAIMQARLLAHRQLPDELDLDLRDPAVQCFDLLHQALDCAERIGQEGS
jgi:hypothetical protein